MHRLGKIAGTTLFGGALVVGTAGAAFADGGTDGGQTSPQTPSSQQPQPNTSPDSGTSQDSGTQGTEDGQDTTTTTNPGDRDATTSDQNGSTEDRDGTSQDQDGTSQDQQSPASPTGSTSPTGTARPDTTPGPNQATPLTPQAPTSAQGTATPSTTPPAFCADAAMLHSWFAQREATLARRISALGAAEGAAAARGNTAAVTADRARITQLTGVESFLRAADAQLTSICGTA